MTIIMCAVTKEVSFQGRAEKFANVYTLDWGGGLEESDLLPLADDIVAAERLAHANTVTFTGVQIWDAGTPPNYMRLSKLLTSAGQASPDANCYRECAMMLTAPLPRRQGVLKTVRRDLRKWYHFCTNHDMNPTGASSSGQPTAGSPVGLLIAKLNNGFAGGAVLCAPNGDHAEGPWTRRPYVEHRQFPRGRKEG